MEPARNGRDDRPAPGGGGRRDVAAMEPARNGRDDPDPGRHPLRQGRRRNGARPVMGGMTDRETGEKVFEVRPQWSPPVMGGMTGPCSLAASQAKGAAMEPARNGRDDRPGPRPLPAERGPQWSPPVMGGMTP